MLKQVQLQTQANTHENRTLAQENPLKLNVVMLKHSCSKTVKIQRKIKLQIKFLLPPVNCFTFDTEEYYPKCFNVK